MSNILASFVAQIPSIQLMLVVITAILHILFAGAVAKDAGQLNKRGLKTHLVSGATWAFAVLVGGPLIAVGYWFMHHLKPYH
ncbi:MAG: hypothetical protein KBD83_00320 [Gammaproteobacteria bacterium]|jgi:hypothetical protein|nr:hypothetical protein [Gammaproteobacteria bacterium]